VEEKLRVQGCEFAIAVARKDCRVTVAIERNGIGDQKEEKASDDSKPNNDWVAISSFPSLETSDDQRSQND